MSDKSNTTVRAVLSMRYVWYGFQPFVALILILGGIAVAPLPAIFFTRFIRWTIMP